MRSISYSRSGGIVGGVVGNMENGGLIANCSCSANITDSNGNYIGGIVAQASSTAAERNLIIDNCTNTGTIKTTNTNLEGYMPGAVGGIAGTACCIIIRNCINKGEVTGLKYAGGIVGSVSNQNLGSSEHGTEVVNCGNTGKITGAE